MSWRQQMRVNGLKFWPDLPPVLGTEFGSAYTASSFALDERGKRRTCLLATGLQLVQEGRRDV